MNLFFETADQGVCFLCAIPLGVLLSFFLDGRQHYGAVRALMDAAAMLCAGIALLALTAFLQEEKLRMYHVLGLLVGCILYVTGVGKLRSYLRKLLSKACIRARQGWRKRKKPERTARSNSLRKKARKDKTGRNFNPLERNNKDNLTEE